MEENLKLLKDIKNELVKITTTLATENIENKCTLDDVIKVSNRNIEKTQVEMAKIRLDEFSQLIYNLIKNFPQTIPIFNYLQGINLKNIEDVLIKFSGAENVEL